MTKSLTLFRTAAALLAFVAHNGHAQTIDLLRDINTTTRDAQIQELTPSGQQVFFTASDLADRKALWVTDGTEAGTQKLLPLPVYERDIQEESIRPFSAGVLLRKGRHEIWYADGTPNGARLVRSFDPDKYDWVHTWHTSAHHALLHAVTNSGVSEFWRTDGTDTGTVRIHASTQEPRLQGAWPLQELNGQIYFRATTSAYGRELWRMHPTLGQPVLVRDLHPGPVSSNIQNLFELNGRVYFIVFAQDGIDRELWRTDGTPVGTERVDIIRADRVDGLPLRAAKVGNRLYVIHYTPEYGAELWSTDGTPGGLQLVRDIVLGPTATNTRAMVEANGMLALFVGDQDTQMWRSDGTAAGTQAVRTLTGLFNRVVPIGRRVFVETRIDTGDFHYRMSATHIDTGESQQIARYLSTGSAPVYWPVALGHKLLFRQRSPALGAELWITDGTRHGTKAVTDIQRGTAGSRVVFGVTTGERLYLSADDGLRGHAPWITDGTTPGTFPLGRLDRSAARYPIDHFAAYAGHVFFLTREEGRHRLWRTSATPGNVREVWRWDLAINSLVPAKWMQAIDGGLLIARYDADTGTELWRYDAGQQTAALLKDIRPGPDSAVDSRRIVLGNRIIFAADDGVRGWEPWVTDASTAGTTMLRDLLPGAAGSEPQAFVRFAAGVAFIARQPTGRRIFLSDGTAAGTNSVAIGGDARLYNGSTLVAGEGLLFFSATDVSFGREPWASDGTPEGTRRLADILPGPQHSQPRFLAAIGRTALFEALGDRWGYALWASDGTAATTGAITDAQTGESIHCPCRFIADGDDIVFVARQIPWHQGAWRKRPGSFVADRIEPQPQFADELEIHSSQIARVGSSIVVVGRTPEHAFEPWVIPAVNKP